MIESRALFEKALALDPNFADAMAGLAWTYVYDYMFGWTSPDTDYDAKIFGLTNRSIELVPNNAYGYAAKAMYLIFSGRPRDALDVTDTGLARNPNSSMLYLQRSMAEASLGVFEKAKSDAEQALKLEPRGPLSTWGLRVLGDAELGLGDYDAATHSYELSRQRGFPDLTLEINLAAAEAMAGRVDRGRNWFGGRPPAKNPTLRSSGVRNMVRTFRRFLKACERRACQRGKRVSTTGGLVKGSNRPKPNLRNLHRVSPLC